MPIVSPQKRLKDLPLEALYTLDMESSGHAMSDDSYPISIGVSGPCGRLWHWLIKPAEEWDSWDEIAEEIHGIGREDLEEGGWDSFLLCRELNRTFSGKVLVVDSFADLLWSKKLFDATGVSMSFDIAHLSSVLEPAEAQRVMGVIENTEWPHKADEDARLLRNAITLHCD